LLGIDAEPNGPLPEGVAETVTVPSELAMLDRLAGTHPGTHWGRLLFSAKEAVYKAWFPLTQRWLGFQEASGRGHQPHCGGWCTYCCARCCRCVDRPVV
jgi:4'-phosphopantetheinyl transferase EntD